MIVANENLINVLVLSDPLHTPWQLTGVYGPTIPTAKPIFWDMMKQIGEAFMGPWLVIGDSNNIVNQNEKQGGRSFASSSRNGFQDMIDELGMIDLGYVGHSFTWNNKRGGDANIEERLDRGMVNGGEWRILFPKVIL